MLKTKTENNQKPQINEFLKALKEKELEAVKMRWGEEDSHSASGNGKGWKVSKGGEGCASLPWSFDEAWSAPGKWS